jgi:hypothetical protein
MYLKSDAIKRRSDAIEGPSNTIEDPSEAIWRRSGGDLEAIWRRFGGDILDHEGNVGSFLEETFPL